MTIPLKHAPERGRRVSNDLGLGTFGTFIGQLTRTALYVPQFLKLQFNQFVAPLTTEKDDGEHMEHLPGLAGQPFQPQGQDR